jgi:hypothetical protein
MHLGIKKAQTFPAESKNRNKKPDDTDICIPESVKEFLLKFLAK